MSRLSKRDQLDSSQHRPFAGMSKMRPDAAGLDIGAHEIGACVSGEEENTQEVQTLEATGYEQQFKERQIRFKTQSCQIRTSSCSDLIVVSEEVDYVPLLDILTNLQQCLRQCFGGS